LKRAFLATLLFATSAGAQGSTRIPRVAPPTAPSNGPTNLRSHVGTDHAARLLRSPDPDERLRGVERAASIGSAESLALLVESLERSQQLKGDTRALLAAARGLARFADQERARAGLMAILGAGHPDMAGRLPTTTRDSSEEGDPVARAELARQVAAIALARSGGDRALEALYGAARSGGSRQNAAMLALTMYPPRDPGFLGTTAVMPASTVRMLGQLGDLRALDVLHAAARSSDVGVRCAALLALAELGDTRAIPLAIAAIAENDARLRAAAGEVFILLNAPQRFQATTSLIADEATTSIGIKMAERVHNAEITKLVAARAWQHPDRELRLAAIHALGRSPDPGAAKALVAPQLLGDKDLVYQAIHALARSPAPNAGELVAGLFPTRLASLAVRAYVVRAIVRGERDSSSDSAAFKMASGHTENERALGVFARVALGDADADGFLEDKSARVRRAAVMGSLADGVSPSMQRAFLARIASDPDPVTRQLLAIGLIGGDPDGIAKTSMLIDRAESAGGDAALSTFALARRADETTANRVGQLLESKDVVQRTHAARGLGLSTLPDATGRLAELYAYETDPIVRRAVVSALALRAEDESAPARRETLAMAADLDPDGLVRQAARRAILGAKVPLSAPAVREVAWLRVTRDGGAPQEPYVGSLVRSDGLAVPIVFDEEGYAVVPGLPPGESRLVLAPRLPGKPTP
jgi:HEAT repeat protein